ncbi:MAG: hypothetical protein WC341_16370 [Bacteroidales bacterium]|jgi:hypothetical protein
MSTITNDPSDNSYSPGVEHCDGHVSPAPTGDGRGSSSSEGIYDLIKSVLQGMMNGRAGDAARVFSESPVVLDAVAGAATHTTEVAKDVLSTIGESLSKDQP